MEIFDKSQIRAALRQSFGSLVYAINEMTENEFITSGSPEKWSPGKILGHLILSTKPLSKAMSIPKEALRAKFGILTREEMSFTGVQKTYYSKLNQGVKAPPSFVYEGVTQKGKERMIASFTSELNKLLELTDSWNEKDLSTHILPHPALGDLSIREMLFFTHFHTLHHLEQVIAHKEVSV